MVEPQHEHGPDQIETTLRFAKSYRLLKVNHSLGVSTLNRIAAKFSILVLPEGIAPSL